MAEELRVLYAAGSGNVIGTYHHWTAGRDDPSQVSITYSSQFYDVCKDLNAVAYVISSCRDRQIIRDNRFIIEHRPRSRASGFFYHLVHLLYGLQLIISTLRFKADVVIVADGTSHWFVFSLLHWLGVLVIPSLHCVLWSKYGSRTLTQQTILKLDAMLFKGNCAAILAVSDDVSTQIDEITANQHRPVLKFLPIYRRADFEGISQPSDLRSPFVVLFAGRIETNKGVFDLLEVAKRFISLGEKEVEFDVCGNGSMLMQLREAASEAGVTSFFHCHGHCEKRRMHKMLNRSHVIIVPTRANFVEGFNKVVVEGVLSGRPVITSSVCPALNYVKEAVLEVAPNDVEAYGNAILKLRDDRNLYEEKQKNCLSLQEQFYDSSNGWSAALKSILVNLQKEGK